MAAAAALLRGCARQQPPCAAAQQQHLPAGLSRCVPCTRVRLGQVGRPQPQPYPRVETQLSRRRARVERNAIVGRLADRQAGARALLGGVQLVGEGGGGWAGPRAGINILGAHGLAQGIVVRHLAVCRGARVGLGGAGVGWGEVGFWARFELAEPEKHDGGRMHPCAMPRIPAEGPRLRRGVGGAGKAGAFPLCASPVSQFQPG